MSNLNKIENYLDRVCSKIRLRRVHKGVKLELRDHIAELVAEYSKEGQTEDAAVDEALNQLGDPVEVGAGFNRSYHRRYLFSLAIKGTVALALVFGTMLALNIVQHDAQQLFSSTENSIIRNTEALLQDQRDLEKEPFFVQTANVPVGHGNDAGIILNAKLSWDGEGAVPPIPELTEPWLSHVADADYSKYDLSWFAALARFDYWDFFQSNPSAQTGLALPVPHLGTLLAHTKLRLMKGLYDKQPIDALREVRQLARLLYSTETGLGERAALRVLALEGEAYEEAVKRQLMAASAWTPVSPASLATARRVVVALDNLFSVHTPDEVMRKVFTSPGQQVGICAALADGIATTSIYRNFLSGRFPFELNFAAKFDLMDQMVSKAGQRCRLTYVRDLWKKEEARYYPFLTHVPYLRQAIGMQLMWLATTNGIEVYDRQ